MTTKLTLTMEDKVIDSAKKYAQKNGKSLSNLVENYLKSITTKEQLLELDSFAEYAETTKKSETPCFPAPNSHSI